MNVDPDLQLQLLDLAEIDAELNRVRHQRENLPVLAEIAELEPALRVSKDALVELQITAGDLDRDLKRQEREVDSVRAREDRDRQLMASGSVSAKQLTDLQHELQTLQRRQGALEDDLLEMMERRETLDNDEKAKAAELANIEQRLADAQQRRDTALAELDEVRVTREADRAELVGRFPAELLARYDRARTSHGRGAGLLRARRCGSCQLELDRSLVSDIRNSPAEAVVACDNCGAILVRTAESGL